MIALRCRAIVARRHHQRVDGAPRFAHPADIAIADGQLRDLLDDLHTVRQFLLGILVGEDAFRVARTLQVDTKAEILVGGEPGVHHAVGIHEPVPAPIGIELDDRRAPRTAAQCRRVVPVVTVEGDRGLIAGCTVKLTVFGKGTLSGETGM
jgi:hypothetical protein